MYGFLICTAVLLLLYAALMAIYIVGWKRLPLFSRQEISEPKTKVSVLIPARNEADNIAQCLGSILANNYPKELLEVIVIDDFSTDETAVIAERLLSSGYGRLLALSDYIPAEERINAYKKKALSIAISEAQGQLILTTDADCVCPPSWIREVVALYEQSRAKAIVAPVSFVPAKGRDGLYYFQSLDFMTMQGITAASTYLDHGSMSNGANFAFEKEAFDEVGGYRGVDHIASGDDMLLLYKIKKRFPNSVRYLKSREAIVHTPCQPTLKGFIHQRIRWASKSSKYDDKLLIGVLTVVYLCNLCLFLLLLWGLFSPQMLLIFLGALALKTSMELGLLLPVAGFYQKRTELLHFPYLQPFHILYIVSTGILGLFGHYRWKGRWVK